MQLFSAVFAFPAVFIGVINAATGTKFALLLLALALSYAVTAVLQRAHFRNILSILASLSHVVLIVLLVGFALRGPGGFVQSLDQGETNRGPPPTTAVPTMPDVVGLAVEQAKLELEAAGVVYEERPLFDPGSPEVVRNQNPEPGSPVPGKATISVARQGVSRYLTSENELNANVDYETARSINGRIFTQSVALGEYDCGEPLEYNLQRGYKRFRATIGIDDNAPAETALVFEVVLDGERQPPVSLRFGDEQEVDIDVTDKLRLQLFVHSSGCDDNYGVWGDAQLIGLPGEAPPETTSEG